MSKNQARQLATISCETMTLTTLPDALLDDDTISPMAKLAYWYLRRHDGRVWVPELMNKLESGYDTTWSTLGDLQGSGWIQIPEAVADEDVVRFTVHEVAVTVR
jgi:hypothetical protein